MSRIIDFHTHVFPEAMAKKVLPELKGKAGIEYFNDGTVESLLGSMTDGGVDISVISRITTKPERAEVINIWLLSIRRENIIPMAAWHPDLDVNDSEIQQLLDKGFKCIKLHPDYQNFFVDEERLFPLYEAAQNTGMAILFHAGPDRGLPPPVHALPHMFKKIHLKFPDLKIIAAHMGGEDNYDETEQHLLGTGVYLDTSFILRKMPLETLERMIKKHPVERILFGSDSPWNDQKGDIDFLFSLPFINSTEKQLIAGENAAELLGLK